MALPYYEIWPSPLLVWRNGGRIQHRFMKNRLSGAVPVGATRIGWGKAVGLVEAAFVLARNKKQSLAFSAEGSPLSARPDAAHVPRLPGAGAEHRH